MPRKGHTPKRTVEADPVYGSDLVTKFINSMMWQGKKSTAEGIFYKALTKLQEKGGDEALKLFKKAVENAKPLLEVKTRRVGGGLALRQFLLHFHPRHHSEIDQFVFRLRLDSDRTQSQQNWQRAHDESPRIGVDSHRV